jgi:hypothetical protein
MSQFLGNAEHILEVASAGIDPNLASREMAILLQRDGGVKIMEAGGWALDALYAHSGAPTVYRVSRCAGRVRVEGRSGSQYLLLESGALTQNRPSACAATQALLHGTIGRRAFETPNALLPEPSRGHRFEAPVHLLSAPEDIHFEGQPAILSIA